MKKKSVDDSTFFGKIEKAQFQSGIGDTVILEVEGWFINTLDPLVALQLGFPGAQMILANRGALKEYPASYKKIPNSDNTFFKASLPLPSNNNKLELIHFLATMSDGITVAGGLQVPDNINNEFLHISNNNIKKNQQLNTQTINCNYLELQKNKLSEFLQSPERLTFHSYKHPDVSIIIPLFNKAELTLECLRSLKNTQGISFEIILINNASSDQTSQLLKKLSGVTIINNDNNLHFIQACNQGAEKANGEYILFLNSDTWVSPYAIYHAKKTIEESDKVGVVGARITGIDGLIQEAGSILYQDGSSEGYCRGMPSEYSPAMFQREVDYVSGAFLLTPRSLFLLSGKFDTAYFPAYYEDVDYCTRLWDMGYKVIYEPNSYIVHLENGSSDSKFATTYQLINREKFLRKTKTHGYRTRYSGMSKQDLRFAVNYNFKKSILVIDDQIPLMYKGSGFPRTIQLLNCLLEMGHRVTFVAMLPCNENWAEIRTAIDPRIEVIREVNQANILNFFKSREDYFDLLIVSRPQNMEVINNIKCQNTEVLLPRKIIYDAEAITALREIQKLEVTKNIIASPEDKRYIINKEIEICSEADWILAVSEIEALTFRSFGYNYVDILPHSVNFNITTNSFEQRNKVISIGPLYESDSPNSYATKKFIYEIWPEVRKVSENKFNFCHIGLSKIPDFQTNKEQQVEFMGMADDLFGYFENARVHVACHEYSAGIPLKCIEAAAFGVPSVISKHLSEKLGWQDGVEALVASNNSDFAKKINLLLTDKLLWEQIRDNAYKFVISKYSKEKFKSTLQRVIDNCSQLRTEDVSLLNR
jgi:GT2 family glycosyltransferase/glycosyltransferase involved in cell wall biosynthesis